ncbi:alpha-N-acetylgalactosaminidase [Trichonephila clavipes]|nr:alpha-N-acetylgalactosaminidase [Trichonephila clavipes]
MFSEALTHPLYTFNCTVLPPAFCDWLFNSEGETLWIVFPLSINYEPKVSQTGNQLHKEKGHGLAILVHFLPYSIADHPPFCELVQQVYETPNYKEISKHCNLWRNFNDIEDSWASVLSIIDFYASHQDELVAAAGPGHWNDPDMILAGNFGLSFEEARAQFALWAIMASPLLVSNDLRSLDSEFRELLLNKDVIDVNQDPLGIMGKRIYQKSNMEIWIRPISPLSGNGKYSYAVVFFNRRTLGGPVEVSANVGSLGLDSVNCYDVNDVFSAENSEKYCPSDNITLTVNPSGNLGGRTRNILRPSSVALKRKNQEINRLQLAVKLPWAIFFESVDILS